MKNTSKLGSKNQSKTHKNSNSVSSIKGKGGHKGRSLNLIVKRMDLMNYKTDDEGYVWLT